MVLAFKNNIEAVLIWAWPDEKEDAYIWFVENLRG
jgi:hypothetical protein